MRKRHWKEEGYKQKFKYEKPVEGQLVCDYCGRKFKAGLKHHKFVSHLYSHLPPEAFVCSLCGVDYKVMKKLRHHLRRKHGGKNQFNCEICGRGYKHKNGLQIHQMNEHGYGECEICHEFLKSKEEMVKHMATHGNFECDQCQKDFLTPQRLRDHMKRHKLNGSGGPGGRVNQVSGLFFYFI